MASNEHIFPEGDVEASFAAGTAPDHFGLQLDFDGRRVVIHMPADRLERLGYAVLNVADAARGHEAKERTAATPRGSSPKGPTVADPEDIDIAIPPELSARQR